MSGSKNLEIDNEILKSLTIRELGKFIEPLGYLARQSEESGNTELSRKIEECIDYIYGQINEKIKASEGNHQPR